MPQQDGSQRMDCGKGSFPSTMWIMGIKLWSSALTVTSLPAEPKSLLTDSKVTPSRSLLGSIAALVYLVYCTG